MLLWTVGLRRGLEYHRRSNSCLKMIQFSFLAFSINPSIFFLKMIILLFYIFLTPCFTILWNNEFIHELNHFSAAHDSKAEFLCCRALTPDKWKFGENAIVLVKEHSSIKESQHNKIETCQEHMVRQFSKTHSVGDIDTLFLHILMFSYFPPRSACLQ